MPNSPYAEILRALADGKQVQYLYTSGTWRTLDETQVLRKIYLRRDPVKFRVAPTTIEIGNYAIPEPLRVAPAKRTRIYTIDLDSPEAVHQDEWEGKDFQQLWLIRGLVHTSRDAAFDHAAALISFTLPKVKPEDLEEDF